MAYLLSASIKMAVYNRKTSSPAIFAERPHRISNFCLYPVKREFGAIPANKTIAFMETLPPV
jgi:hypothetical protein